MYCPAKPNQECMGRPASSAILLFSWVLYMRINKCMDHYGALRWKFTFAYNFIPHALLTYPNYNLLFIKVVSCSTNTFLRSIIEGISSNIVVFLFVGSLRIVWLSVWRMYPCVQMHTHTAMSYDTHRKFIHQQHYEFLQDFYNIQNAIFMQGRCKPFRLWIIPRYRHVYKKRRKRIP